MTFKGTVVESQGDFVFDNEDGTRGQRLSTGKVGEQTERANLIGLEPFRNRKIEVDGEFEHDFIVSVTRIEIVG